MRSFFQSHKTSEKNEDDMPKNVYVYQFSYLFSSLLGLEIEIIRSFTSFGRILSERLLFCHGCQYRRF